MVSENWHPFLVQPQKIDKMFVEALRRGRCISNLNMNYKIKCLPAMLLERMVNLKMGKKISAFWVLKLCPLDRCYHPQRKSQIAQLPENRDPRIARISEVKIIKKSNC